LQTYIIIIIYVYRRCSSLKIYTKTGDKGTTSDVLGQRISKGDIKIELQGSIDEINAGAGYLRALLNITGLSQSDLDLDSGLQDIQYALFRIGGDVSADLSGNYIKEADLEHLEKSIDLMENATGPLENFIYYSGSEAATYCHVVRSAARRAERVFVRYMENKEYNLDYQYINRLSDYLFSLARYINLLSKVPDEAMKLK
jgi:cob(I)alamin adenosyltransferase